MKFLALITISLLSLTASAANFCVGNFSGRTITWSLDGGNGGVAAINVASHSPGQQWICEEMKDGTTLVLEVAVDGQKYSAANCVANVKGNQYVHVTPGKDEKNPLKCKLANRDGTEKEMALEAPDKGVGLVLEGDISASGPVSGAVVRVYDRAGKVIGTSQPSSKQGLFSLKLANYAGHDEFGGLRVEASGGRANGKAFQGRMSTTLSAGFDPESTPIYINPVHNLISRYAQTTASGLGQADNRVRRYLGIPDYAQLNDLPSTGFSSDAYLKAAANEGGFEKLNAETLDIMKSSDTASRPFTGPKLLKISFSDILEKLAGALAEEVAKGIFDEIREGTTIAGFESKVWRALEAIEKHLVEISANLKALEAALTEMKYSDRANEIWTPYVEIKDVKGNIEYLRKKLSESVVTTKTREEASAAAFKYQKDILERVPKFMSIVSSKFQVGTDVRTSSMPYLFAKYQLQTKNMVDRVYLMNIDAQVQMYKEYVMTALLWGIWAAGENDTLGGSFRDQAKILMDQMVVQYPDEYRFFAEAKNITDVREGKIIYDYRTGRIWSMTYRHWPNCPTFNSRDHKAEWKQADLGLYREIWNHLNRPAIGAWDALMMDAGMSATEAKGKRVIAVGCDIGSTYGAGVQKFQWFLNQKSPWYEFWDNQAQYESQVRAWGQEAGMYTLEFRNFGR